MSDVTLRAAVPADVPALEALIAASARALGRGFYTDAETEAAITHVFGVDSALVADGSYFVAEVDGALAGCGGWSARRTLFGGDRFAGREDDWLDPATDAARIRAFFVAPAFARRGVGRAILTACEEAARAAGFRTAALMATLPGVPFYAASGYVAGGGSVFHDCGGIRVRFVPMTRPLLQ
ncbi:MAG: GNAT family N-acetyltransferase [Sphingomonadaceae bacterium]|nr:GNAT family N-acetyltransferase [Sphingomonadaceae bacterium]